MGTLEANIKQLQQDQALLPQRHQQQFQQKYGSPTQAQHPQSQAQPQQRQPQVIQLQPQQQQQQQPQQPQPQVSQLQPQQQQQQQQQAQPHHLLQQPGAEAVPPGGIQILHPFITYTG